MEENKEKLKTLIGKGIKISKFVNFEAEWEKLLGVEINPIIDFFVYTVILIVFLLLCNSPLQNNF